MPSKQLIAYAAPGSARGGGANTAHRHRAAAPGHAKMPPLPRKTLMLVLFYFLIVPARGDGGARLFAAVSGLLSAANALQKADPFSKKQCIAIEKVLAGTF